MKKGFTLIELIVVIVMGTILMSIAGAGLYGIYHALH